MFEGSSSIDQDSYLSDLEKRFVEKGLEPPERVQIRSLRNPVDRDRAVKLVIEGNVIAVYNGGVWALFWDGANEAATQMMLEIKGSKRENKPSAGVIDMKSFIDMVDKSKIPEKLQKYFLDVKVLSILIGSFSFLRMPIRDDVVSTLPPHMVHKSSEDGLYYFQNWSSNGIPSIDQFLKKLRNSGVNMIAVTSMNKSGIQSEIVDDIKGIIFAFENGLDEIYIDPTFFSNSNNLPKRDAADVGDTGYGLNRGSYSILQIDPKNGISVKRIGTFGLNLYEAILRDVLIETGSSLDSSSARLLEGRQHNIPISLFEGGLSPEIINTSILAYLNGKSENDIIAWRTKQLKAQEKRLLRKKI